MALQYLNYGADIDSKKGYLCQPDMVNTINLILLFSITLAILLILECFHVIWRFYIHKLISLAPITLISINRFDPLVNDWESSQRIQNRWDNVAKKPFDFKEKKVSHFVLTH